MRWPCLALVLALTPAAAAPVETPPDLARALRMAECQPTTTRLRSRGARTSVYEVTCRDRADRPLTIVCTAGRCLAEDPAADDEEDDDEADG